MIASLLFALAVPKPGPAFPPMTSAAFQDSVTAIEEKTVQGDFAGARKLAALLPKPAFTVGFDDRKLPAELRPSFLQAYGAAVTSWHIHGVVSDEKPDIKFAFTSVLADDPESGVPGNVVTFFSAVPNEPRLSAVIGLKRGRPSRATTPGDVYNDVRYAIGIYLGLARHSLPGYAMYGGPGGDEQRTLGTPELRSASSDLDLSQILRRAIDAHTAIAPVGRSEAHVSPSRFEDAAIQGDQVEFAVQLANKGAGTLVVNAVGDCGCVVPISAPRVAPNGTGVLRLRLETREYSNPIERHVVVYTNDPNLPVYVIPVRLNISPRYRILVPDGTSWVVDEGGKSADAYLTFPHGSEMTVLGARMIGMEGATVKYEPWSGSLPDPERNEGPKQRQGYRFRIQVPEKRTPGRSPVTLTIATGDSEFPVVYQTINLQHGIIALPEQIYLGDVGARPVKAPILLSRPGHPFKVLSAKSDLQSFSVSVVPGDHLDEVKLDVRYDGTALPGLLSGRITITTDDPQQPTLTVPIAGNVQ